jgi:hypothetical protein
MSFERKREVMLEKVVKYGVEVESVLSVGGGSKRHRI